MTYESLLNLIYHRINNGIEPVISEEEAMDYLGKDLIEIIDLIYKFQEDYGFQIYTYGCFSYHANKIIEHGYHWSSEIIDKNEFVSKTGCKQIKSLILSVQKKIVLKHFQLLFHKNMMFLHVITEPFIKI